jgi:predicted DCC family thiol-disulfide oxidoreductase YuxK
MRLAGRVGTVPIPPIRPVLIYDASCGFCRRWVGRLRRWDRRGRIDLLPLDDPSAVALSGQPVERLRLAAHMVSPLGGVFAGAAAVRELFRYLPGGRCVQALAVIPGMMSIAERTYAWIARQWGPVP